MMMNWEEEGKEEEEEEREMKMMREEVGKVIRKKVGEEWDGEEEKRLFKAFSGQRSDWEPLFLFWRDLILHICRHLRIFLIRPSQVKNIWFSRGGLTPLCLDHVLLEMYKAGDVLRPSDLPDPKCGRLSYFVQRAARLITSSAASSTPLLRDQDLLIVSTLLREKAFEVDKVLSDCHWTSSCIITMSKFQDICGGSKEASAILSHLSGGGKARYLSINKSNLIEGVKVSLSSKVVSTTSLDYNVLHLTWTAEKLQQQLDVIDERSDKSKKLALASLKSGNKIIALRNAREIKLASESREKCSKLLSRVEEVLGVIAEADDTKEVCEALQIGARAIKDNNITIEEVQMCLEELDEGIYSHKQIEEALGSTPLYPGVEDEDIEQEFEKLELEIRKGSLHTLKSHVPMGDGTMKETVVETSESLCNALSSLKLASNTATEAEMQGCIGANKVLKDHHHEAA